MEAQVTPQEILAQIEQKNARLDEVLGEIRKLAEEADGIRASMVSLAWELEASVSGKEEPE